MLDGRARSAGIGLGSSHIYETRQDEGEEFGLSKSFRLIDDRISYQALTELRELMRLGYGIHFA